MREQIIVAWEILRTPPVGNKSGIIKWMATASRIKEDLFLVRLIAKLAPGHMLVSQRSRCDNSKNPTQLTFKRNNDLETVGRCHEIGHLVAPTDDRWGDFPYRHGKIISYMQKVRLKDDRISEIGGIVNYQVVTESVCFEPQMVPFNINIEALHLKQSVLTFK